MVALPATSHITGNKRWLWYHHQGVALLRQLTI
jgi:hypothetical protein